jgi:hypothetical protein
LLLASGSLKLQHKQKKEHLHSRACKGEKHMKYVFSAKSSKTCSAVSVFPNTTANGTAIN